MKIKAVHKKNALDFANLMEYKELGNNSRVAKNPKFIEEVYKLLEFKQSKK